MSSVKERYNELVSLTKLFLIQEYTPREFISSSPESLGYFRKVAAAARANKPTAPTPQQPLPQSATAPKAPEVKKVQPSPTTPSQPPVTATPPLPAAARVEPAPAKEVPSSKEVPKEDIFFVLDPMKEPSPSDFKEVTQLIAQHLPGYPVLSSIPDDRTAKEVSSAWKRTAAIPQVLILSFNETDKHQIFLHNIAKAISISIAPASVMSAYKLEEGKQWEKVLQSKDLRFIIACDGKLSALPGLMKHFKENAKQGNHTLGNVPLLLLSDLSFYMKEPKLKAVLWQAIRAQ